MIVDTTCTITHPTVADVSAWYPVPFQYETVLSVPQIIVKLDNEELSYITDYVVGVSGLQLTAEPEADKELVITRSTPFSQDTDFQTGYIDPDEIEHSFDLAVMRDQEIREQLAKDEIIIEDHEERITEAEGEIDILQDTVSRHIDNVNNPHQTSLVNLTDTNINSPQIGHFLMFDGLRWINTVSSGTVGWGAILGDIADQTDLKDALDSKVNIDGTSIMTAPLKFASGSMRGAVGPYLNGVSFWKMDSQYTATNIANLTDSRFLPVSTNSIDLGRTANTWKDLYLGGKAYVGTINNGADLSVPNKSGTLATTNDVELAARSGRMLTDQGVWYAKMHTETVAPSAEDDTNYADFSQVDGDNNPIIVIYTRTSGAWVQSETIVPPADYDGYVPITSKIWDIAEQAGQQGGRVLWNHTSKEFTPYPVIISFEDIEVTGDSTVIMPMNPSANQIVNKNYVDTHAGTSNYHPSLFAHEWDDKIRDDVQWLRADTFSWQAGSAYEAAFNELFNDIYISTSWYASGYANVYTKSPTPAAGDTVYSDSACTTSVGTVTSYEELNNSIVYSGTTYTYNSNTYVTPTSETVAGYTVSVYTGHSGRKITIPSYETAVSNIYTATGVAWYYIIDVPNKRFKLPRSKRNKYTQTLSVIGTGKVLGLTSGNDTFALNSGATYARLTIGYNVGDNVSSSGGYDTGVAVNYKIGVSEDPTLSGLTTTTMEEDTDQCKYLYFYVGAFTQTALENTAGLNASLFNAKVDVGHEVIAFQAPNAGNNYTWYRKYSDGWVEQGGYYNGNITTGSSASVSLPITMADANYTCTITGEQNSNSWSYGVLADGSRTTTGFQIYAGGGSSSDKIRGASWEVKGMAA